MINRIYLRFRSVFMRRRLEREMREEMSAHIASATARNIERGMLPAAAAKAAEREFGNVLHLQEEARDARGSRWIDAINGDVRFALRHFRRTPLATITMVLVLALGIGVNIALFTFFNSIFTYPGPAIPRNESLVRIRGIDVAARFGRIDMREMAYGEVLEYGRQEKLFSAVAASAAAGGLLASEDQHRPALVGTVAYASDNFFQVLNVRPALGRTWSATPLDADPATVLTAVISRPVWERVFDSAPDVVGRTFRINDTPVTVVGVMPRGFRGSTERINRFGVWLPLAAYPIVQRGSMHLFSSPDSARFTTVALLRPGIDTNSAMPTVKAIATRADAARTPRVAMLAGGPMRWSATADVVPMTAHNEDPRDADDLKLAAVLMGALTFLVLLITCANVSSLLVGIAVSRRREIAVRLSLGATRRRLIGQLLTESVLLAFTAAALGTYVVWTVLRVLTTRFPGEIADQLIVLDWRSTLFTIGFAILTGVLFGLSPALHATRLAFADVLKDAAGAVSGSRSILQRALVVVQITLTQPLLVAVGAALLLSVADMQRLTTSELDERVVNLDFNVFTTAASTAELHGDMARIQERLRGVPGVAGAVAEQRISTHRVTAHPADRHAASPLPDTVTISGRMVAPGYLALWDIRILRGRDFLASEMDSTISSVIIGDRFARGLFGDADPVGRRLRFDRDSLYMEVIGVADEAAIDGLRSSMPDTYQPIIFWPINTMAVPSRIVLRSHGPAAPLLSHLRAAAFSVAPHLQLRELHTVRQLREEDRRSLLQGYAAVGAAGLLALFLSAIGLYAVVSFAVNQRTREIGIRTALGAHRGQVVGLFFKSGVRLSAFGLVLGLPLSLIALRIIADQTGMGPISTPTVAASVAIGVLIVASLATWLPARRAASVDPLIALRSE